MITKINDRKIEHQTNTKTFLKNYDNLIESKTIKNYETQFSINSLSNDKIKKN